MKIKQVIKLFLLFIWCVSILNTKSFSAADTAGGKQTQDKTPQKTKTILDFKTELSLSQEQANQIKELLDNLEKRGKDSNARLESTQNKLSELIKNKADLSVVKSKAQEIAEIQTEMPLARIDAARKTSKILSTKQLNMWNKIQKNQIAKLQGTVMGFNPKIARLNAQLQLLNVDLQDLIQNEADLDLIKSKMIEIAAIQTEIAMLRFEAGLKVKEVVYPKQ